MDYRAWVAKAAKAPLVLDTVDLGPLGPEEVEVAVEHCGVCHSDLSVLNNESSSGVRPGGARIGPGATALTRTSGASSSARLSVSAFTAAFEA